MPGSVVQVLSVDGGVAGAGFLVGEGVVVTCAHVMRAAGREPGGRVELAFPHLPGAPRVWGAVPAEQWREPKAEDIAFVELDSVPPGVRALPLGSGAGCQGHGVSSFGFPAQAPPGGHFGYGTAGDLLPDSTGTGVLLQLSGANELTTGFSGGPVVDGVSGLVIGMVTSITSPDVHLRGLGIAYCTPAEVLRKVRPDLVEHQVCPYRGLEPFTAEHTHWFHGRETAVESVLDALGGQRRMLLLLGPSGAGKSSLIQAGVLPALTDGDLPGSDRWLSVISRPGQDLLTELEHAGLPGAASEGLLPAVQRRLADEPDHDRLLLVIDQFEELLTQAAPTEHGTPDRRTAAVAELLALIDSPAAASVILIMRDDFYPQLASLAPGLLEAAAPATLNVPATLNDRELEAIITLPAQAVGLGIEDGLTARITTDIRATDPGNRAPVTLLPPLELALSQLWERRENGRLTHRAYEQIGGVTGSLATWCDSAIRRLPAEHESTAKHILTSLVRPADQAHAIPATRQQIPLSRLRASITGSMAAGEASGVFKSVLEALIGYRIITTRTVKQPGAAMGESTAELIHDALIRDWGALRDWVAQDHNFQVWLHRIDEQQRRHAETGMPGDLLDGTALAEGTDWVRRHRPLSPEITTYLATSQQRQQATRAEDSRRHRQRRRLRSGIAVLLVTALTAGAVAWQFRRTNAEQQALATARTVAAVANGMRATDPETAALLSIAAWRTAPAVEARGALSQSAVQREIAVFHDPTKSPGAFEAGMSRALSADGRYLTTEVHGAALATKTTRFDIRTGKPAALDKDGETFDIVAPDGKFALSGGVVSDIGTDEPVGKVPDTEDYARALASGGGRVLTTKAGTGPSSVIDTQTGRTLLQVPDPHPALSDDGRYLASCPEGGYPVLYDTESDGSTKLQDADPEAKCDDTSAVWSSADGTRLLTSTGGRLYAWDTAARKLLSYGDVDEDAANVTTHMSPDGTLVARRVKGAIVVSSSEDLETPLLTQETATWSEKEGGTDAGGGANVGWGLAINSEAHELVYLDGNSVHTLDLDTLKLPRQAEFAEIGRYDAETGSLQIVVTGKGSRVQSWEIPDGTRASRALPEMASDVPATLTSSYPSLGRHLGDEDLPAVFSPDGTTVAYPDNAGSQEGQPFHMVLQDVRTGKVRHSVLLDEPERGYVTSMAFSADGRTLAVSRLVAVNQDAWSVDIVDVRKGRKTRTLDGVGGYEIALGGAGDDMVLVTTSGDRADLSGGKKVRGALGTVELSDVEFSPDGKTLAVGEPEGVALWNADGTQRVGRLPAPERGGDRQVSNLRFSPDGRSLVGVVGENRIQIWDVPSRQPVGGVLPGVGDRLLDVVFDDKGNLHLAGEKVRSYTLTLDPDKLAGDICRRVRRAKNLTRAEWAQNVPNAPYQKVCA
ncbi:trypsin-like peptidase domain-containing protein [Streptomyces atratus]|uniref:nSTAND1 domain-containing NTPase n=1 Tax=Streptomyces atratus TaxID=1893 RepID=UPI00368AE313